MVDQKTLLGKVWQNYKMRTQRLFTTLKGRQPAGFASLYNPTASACEAGGIAKLAELRSWRNCEIIEKIIQSK
jgi:hypothetical protein